MRRVFVQGNYMAIYYMYCYNYFSFLVDLTLLMRKKRGRGLQILVDYYYFAANSDFFLLALVCSITCLFHL